VNMEWRQLGWSSDNMTMTSTTMVKSCWSLFIFLYNKASQEVPLQQRIRDGKSSTAAAPRLKFLLVWRWQRRRESIIQWTVDQPWTADDRSTVNGGRWIFDGKEKEQLTDMSLISF
jgi:hypothetical protein